MIILALILSVLFLGGFWAGYRQKIQISNLTRTLLRRVVLGFLLMLILLSLLHISSLLSRAGIARITMGLYAMAAGYFFGHGITLMIRKNGAGSVSYMYRSFWIDIAPNLISVVLVTYGMYRAGILPGDPVTGIGLTSGLSLVGFGFFGWTVRLVPEFRDKGILILDQYIDWKHVLGYEWHTEDSIKIKYLKKGKRVCEFITAIPDEDQLMVERLLSKKIHDHDEERRKMLAREEETD